jgi:hypothetical protein
LKIEPIFSLVSLEKSAFFSVVAVVVVDEEAVEDMDDGQILRKKAPRRIKRKQ